MSDDLRVEELSGQSGVSVDTIRYYQQMGLLSPGTRDGRTSRYGDSHVARLRTIRTLAEDGFTLAQIKRLVHEAGDEQLLETLAGAPRLSRQELAERSKLAPPLVDLAISAGLIEAVDEHDNYSPDAVAMLVAGNSLLEAGIPLDRLAALATRHATGIEDVVDEAIELFSEFVRPTQADSPTDLAKLFQLLLAHVTRLVAQHFHQTVVSRAAERLQGSDDEALAAALAAAESQTLTVTTEWR